VTAILPPEGWPAKLALHAGCQAAPGLATALVRELGSAVIGMHDALLQAFVLGGGP
jgi:hypothetical protein